MEKTKEKLKERIKRLRISADLTQAALAAHAGISLQTIKDIESGRTDAGQKSVTALAQAFGISIEELTGKPDPEPRVYKEKPESVSKILTKIMSVPDDIFDLASQIDKDDPLWDHVRGALDAAIEIKKSSQSQKKGQA